MTSWGTPYLGTKTEVSEDHELSKGDLVCLKSFHGTITTLEPAYSNPTLIINEIKKQFQDEGHFQAKYIKTTFKFISGTELGYDIYETYIEVHAIVLHSSPLVISASVGLIVLACIILGIVITVALWTYYTIEKVGGGGFIFLLIVVALIVVIVIGGFRFKKKGGG